MTLSDARYRYPVMIQFTIYAFLPFFSSSPLLVSLFFLRIITTYLSNVFVQSSNVALTVVVFAYAPYEGMIGVLGTMAERVGFPTFQKR